MDMLPFLTHLLIFLAGLAAGSFANVCILRIPRGESLVSGPSHCVHCGRKLRWFELFPLLSFLALRGRCVSCKEKISAQYPLVEGACGLFWLLAFLVLGFSWQTLLVCLLGSALLVLSVIDARTREIPPGLTWFILALGLAAAALDYRNLPAHVIGFFAVSLPLYLLYAATKGRGIGGGDIKLMAVCGLFSGWRHILLAFFLACLIASLVHLSRMAMKQAGRSLAFGPYLALGVLLSLLWGEAAIRWYVGLFL